MNELIPRVPQGPRAHFYKVFLTVNMFLQGLFYNFYDNSQAPGPPKKNLPGQKMQRLRRNSSRSQQRLLRRVRSFLASEAWGARERSSWTSIHAERWSEGQQNLVMLQAEYLP